MKPIRFKASSKILLLTIPRRYFFCGSFVFLRLLFLVLSRLLIAAFWSPAGKGLTSWLLLVMFIVFVTFHCGILGHVWHLIVSFPDLCRLSYFVQILFVCLILFFTSTQQSFSYAGRSSWVEPVLS